MQKSQIAPFKDSELGVLKALVKTMPIYCGKEKTEAVKVRTVSALPFHHGKWNLRLQGPCYIYVECCCIPPSQQSHFIHCTCAIKYTTHNVSLTFCNVKYDRVPCYTLINLAIHLPSTNIYHATHVHGQHTLLSY
jgi:hypothetical protein